MITSILSLRIFTYVILPKEPGLSAHLIQDIIPNVLLPTRYQETSCAPRHSPTVVVSLGRKFRIIGVGAMVPVIIKFRPECLIVMVGILEFRVAMIQPCLIRPALEQMSVIGEIRQVMGGRDSSGQVGLKVGSSLDITLSKIKQNPPP